MTFSIPTCVISFRALAILNRGSSFIISFEKIRSEIIDCKYGGMFFLLVLFSLFDLIFLVSSAEI